MGYDHDTTIEILNNAGDGVETVTLSQEEANARWKGTAFEDGPLMKPREVSEVLGVSMATLAKWRREGGRGLSFYVLGPRSARYSRKDVEAFSSGGLERVVMP